MGILTKWSDIPRVHNPSQPVCRGSARDGPNRRAAKAAAFRVPGKGESINLANEFNNKFNKQVQPNSSQESGSLLGHPPKWVEFLLASL